MSETRKCPECGVELPPDGPCVPCALRGAAANIGESSSEESPPTTIRVDPPSDKSGDKIGPFKLLEEIGGGGMGTVWMAERTEPYYQKVALKLIKLGMDTKRVVARFQAERQALAMMDHPNIAKILEAGATENGRPYFVMELVRGISITEYCNENKLSTQERLELFIQVCQAIQHAHSKLIIHRDIKPSNILVALGEDGKPMPKVIDFGIAKAIGQFRLTDQTVWTGMKEFIGTWLYMSPEQAQLSALDIDTRSDIYALGVVLYELLTGKTPFDAKRLRDAGLDEIRRVIREEDPPEPSKRLSTLDANEQTTTANQRQTEPPKLLGLIRGDLDWIVMKCLDKIRARRYETANGLAMDVERFLNNEIIVARPPSKLYRFQKFVRRNKLAFAAATTVVVVLVAGIVGTGWQAVRATRAEHDQSHLRQVAQQAQIQAEEAASTAQAAALKSRRNQYAADIFVAHHAIADSNLGHARAILREYFPRSGVEDLRGFEWHYLQALSQGRQSKILHGHSDRVCVIAWSPDGKMIASGGWDSTVRLWDVETAKTIEVLKMHKRRITSVTFSPDGRLLATGAEDSRLQLWNIQNHSVVLTITNPSPRVVFSPNGGMIAVGKGGAFWGGAGGTVELRDCVSGKLVLELPSSGNRAAFSPDGSQLATANGRYGIVIWEVATGHMVRTAPIVGYALSLAFSPDGRFLAFGTGEGEIKLWDLNDEKPSLLRESNGDWVTCVSFAPDGHTLAASLQSHKLELWDITQRREIDKLFGHGGEVWAVAFSPDGRMLASGGNDMEVMLWNPTLRMNDEIHIPAPVDRYFWLGHPLFSKDNSFLAVGDREGHVRLFNAVTLRSQQILTNAGLPVAFDPNGTNLLTRDRQFKQFQLWDVVAGKLASSVSLNLKRHEWIAAAISHDRAFVVAGSLDGSVEFIDPRTGELVGELHSSISCQNLEPSPDGHTLAIGGTDERGHGVVELWDVVTKRRLWRRDGHREAVSAVTFSPDGKSLATGSWDTTIKVWNVGSSQELATLSGHKAGVVRCAFSQDGRTLVSSGDDRTIRFWNFATYREVASFPVSSVTYLLQFSPNGATMLSGADDTFHLWRTRPFPEVESQDVPEPSAGGEPAPNRQPIRIPPIHSIPQPERKTP